MSRREMKRLRGLFYKDYRKPIWEETRRAEELKRDRERAEEERERIVRGLRRCPVCKGAARAEEFGLGGRGVWVGCDRTARCSRNIVLKVEGWSLQEVAEEWNRYNSGILLIIRRLKMWYEKRFGHIAREERRMRRAKEAEAKEKELAREKIFGIRQPEAAKERRKRR